MGNIISNYTKSKIKRISLLLMIAVFVIHANTVSFLANDSMAQQLQLLIVNEICRVAVPMFFLISGFLFFYKTQNVFNLNCYLKKIHSRFFSIFLPLMLYWLINFSTVVIFQLLKGKYIGGSDIDLYQGAIKAASTIYHCWFLRDLLFFTLMSPLIFLSVFYLKIFSVIVTVMFHIYFPHLVVFDTDGIIWFILGAYLAIYGFRFVEKKITSNQILFCGGIWLLLCGLLNWKLFPPSYGAALVRNACGVIFVWYGYDWFCQYHCSPSSKLWSYWDRWSAFTFFIYLFHEPLMSIVRKGILAFLDVKSISVMWAYVIWFILILLIFSILILIGNFWKTRHITSYHLFSGRR